MALVAWSPKGMSAPIELTAVRIQPGKVTERDWVEALADRVQALVDQDPDSLPEACDMLGVPEPDRVEEAGQVMVLRNLNLRTQFNLAMPEQHPFPATVGEPTPEAKDALSLSLMDWAEIASSLASGSSLD